MLVELCRACRIDMGTFEFGDEPAAGDFNDDGFWSIGDINALNGEIVVGSNNSNFDMNGDGPKGR